MSRDRMNTTTPLLDIAELERLQRQTLHHRRVQHRPVAGRWTGAARSLFRGRGMELDDTRAYQSGDDVRYLDWRATARSGRPMSKVFREERPRQVSLVIARSASMYFGTRVGAKAAAAARGAAILAFIALAEHDHVAGLVLDGARERAFPAARHLDGVLPLLRAAGAPMHAALSPLRGRGAAHRRSRRTRTAGGRPPAAHRRHRPRSHHRQR